MGTLVAFAVRTTHFLRVARLECVAHDLLKAHCSGRRDRLKHFRPRRLYNIPVPCQSHERPCRSGRFRASIMAPHPMTLTYSNRTIGMCFVWDTTIFVYVMQKAFIGIQKILDFFGGQRGLINCKLLLTFWKVKSGKGRFFNGRRPQKQQQKQQQQKRQQKQDKQQVKQHKEAEAAHKTEKNKQNKTEKNKSTSKTASKTTEKARTINKSRTSSSKLHKQHHTKAAKNRCNSSTKHFGRSKATEGFSTVVGHEHLTQPQQRQKQHQRQ